MSLRAASRCSAPRFATPKRFSFSHGLRPLPWTPSRSQVLRPLILAHGKKTKTVVKFADLPQGALPPLPDDHVDEVPVKAYPRVIQQHLDNVKKYQGCVVLTRVGDFYELYGDQVEEYAPQVNLKKAKRATSLGDVPMAGFQYAQLERYLKMFVSDLGLAVAISEQVPIPAAERASKAGAALFDRKVSRVVTAGTLVDESFLNAYENNYLLSVWFENDTSILSETTDGREFHDLNRRVGKLGLSWVDLSNGDFFTQASDLASLPSLIARISPREIVLPMSMKNVGHASLLKLFGEGIYSMHFHESIGAATSPEDWTSMLERAVPITEHELFTDVELAAGSLVLDYVKDKLPDAEIKLQPPVRRINNEYMAIDKQSLRGLEIRTTMRDGVFQGSLLHSVRKTVTKSGARLLSQRLVSPSLSLRVINQRLDLVQEMLHHDALREDIIALLRRTADTFRLVQRFSIGKGDADDLLGLARTIDVMAQTRDILQARLDHIKDASSGEPEAPTAVESLLDIINRLDLKGPAKIAQEILAAIDEEGLSRQHSAEDEARLKAEEMSEEVETADATGAKPPRLVRRAQAAAAAAADLSVDDIWIMRKTASPRLQRAHDDLNALLEGKQSLALRLRATLGAESLTLKWNGNLGHHCHIKGKDAKRSIAELDALRQTGSSKSTKTFYYPEWTQLGGRIDSAKLHIRAEEERVFRVLRMHVIENLMKLRRNAAVLDELDVACSSATVARERDLVRPTVTEARAHRIVAGRHPTVDVGLREQGRAFTANDCFVGDRERILLITGPNMAGKSTYLRQTALITVLAQTGCFVPAAYAEVGVVDQLFSRVGAADSLYEAQSTFMVEMLETAAILRRATPRSLVIMDEVGRGTTPDDGLAVAYACLHHLYHVNACRALFATHFHDLADLARPMDRLACYCTDIDEGPDGSWSYLHRLKPGVNRNSHALKVAELAGVPSAAIAVARETMAELERGRAGAAGEGAVRGPTLAAAEG